MIQRKLFSSVRLDKKWIIAVGLEIHAQLKTRTKLFSRAPARFGAEVNSDLEPFDLALPGSQPRINSYAVLLAVKAALAFKCSINPASTFDRKHYFYPDQPAGYQITQHYNALAHDGHFTLFERDAIEQSQSIRVGIIQLQLEQDTARTMYLTSPPQTLVDLNRSGVPLIEIVTTPSLPSAKAAGAALRKIQAILRSIGASDANMESGGMRCDVNVSVTTAEDRHLGPSRRVEIKNLASGRAVMDAVDAESARQISVLKQGGTVGRETRGFDNLKKLTFVTRTKETTTDYRYMPEPDLGPICITEDFITKSLESLGELPDEKLDRLLLPPYSLHLNDARVLLNDDQTYQYYQDVLDCVNNSQEAPRMVANWIVHELQGRNRVMRESGREPRHVTVEQLADIIRLLLDGKLNRSAGKVILQDILDGNTHNVAIIVKEKGLGVLDDTDEIQKVLLAIMQKNEGQASKLRAGDPKIRKWFVGQAMRESKG